MTMAVTEAKATGKKGVLCASTGNTSASAAAYAAIAGIECAVLVPAGKIAMGKLAQAVMYGATIIEVDGNFDDCLELARKTTATFDTIDPSTEEVLGVAADATSADMEAAIDAVTRLLP